MVVGEEFPQGLKPWLIWAFSARLKVVPIQDQGFVINPGMAEAVSFQNWSTHTVELPLLYALFAGEEVRLRLGPLCRRTPSARAGANQADNFKGLNRLSRHVDPLGIRPRIRGSQHQPGAFHQGAVVGSQALQLVTVGQGES